MKMADGGFGPAYNVCMATAGSPLGGPRTIVGVQVTNVGSDMGSVAPMLAEIERRRAATQDAARRRQSRRARLHPRGNGRRVLKP